jgi:hypothetical protein
MIRIYRYRPDIGLTGVKAIFLFADISLAGVSVYSELGTTSLFIEKSIFHGSVDQGIKANFSFLRVYLLYRR